MNYPRVWQYLFMLGIDRRHTTGLGLAFIVMFFVGVYVLLSRAMPSGKMAYVPVAILFSPAIMLGIERSNSDLLVFFLLALVLVLGRWSIVLASCLIVAASVLKLFPVFGVSYFLRESEKRVWLSVCIVSAILATYAALSYHDLVRVFEATPKGVFPAYGVEATSRLLLQVNLPVSFGVAKVTCYLAAIGLAFVVALKGFRSNLHAERKADPQIDSFRIGSAVYLGTFLLGNSWDYRLMFLIFAVPQLCLWGRSPVKVAGRVARTTLVAIVFSCWTLVLPKGVGTILFDEFWNWLVFGGLLFMFCASLPGWFVLRARRALSSIGAGFGGSGRGGAEGSRSSGSLD